MNQSRSWVEELQQDLWEDVLHKSSPYLYPFVIETALIGASVFYLMREHVGLLYVNKRKNVNKPRI